MANELKITDIVGKEAFGQLKDLREDITKTYNHYKNFVQELAGGVKINPKTLQELSEKSISYNKSLNDLIVTQNKIADLQEKYNKTIEDYGNKISKLLALNTLPKQFEDLAKGISKISTSLDNLSSKFQTATTAQSSASQANQSYAQSSNQLNQAITTTGIKYADIIDNIQAYDNNVTQLTANTIQNKNRIKELEGELKRLDIGYKSGGISLTDYLNKSALLKQRQTELSEQNKQYSNLIRNHSAVIISTTSSYNEMNAAVLSLEKRLKSMPKDSFLGNEGQKTLQQIQTLKNELKGMDAQMGNYQRNVGNYASGWNGLGMSVQQVARELPSLAVGWNTFFLAISNNLPILADELKKAKIEYQAMQEAGQKGIPVWKQLIKSIFSWQSTLVIGITLLTVYGKDIMDWVASLFKGEQAVLELASAEKDLADTRKRGISNSVKERAELDLLYKATQDTSRSIEERNEAVDELQKRYPSYFKNMSNEEILAGKASVAYGELKKAIIASAIARAQADKIAENSMKIDEKNNERIGYLTKMVQAQEVLDRASANVRRTQGQDYDVTRQKMIRDQINLVEEYRQKAADTATEIDSLRKSNENLMNKIDVSAYTHTPGEEDDLEKQRELERLAKEQAKYQEDIAKRLSDTRIALIDEEYEKERQTAQKKYDDNISSIKGNSKEENELRKNYEIILQNELREIDKKYLDKRDEEERRTTEGSIEYRLEKLQNGYMMSSIFASQSMQKEINDQEVLYSKGLITKEKYEKEKAEITQRYAIKEAENAIKLLEEQMDLPGISDEEKFKLRKELINAEIKLIEKLRDARVRSANESDEAEKKYWADIQSAIDNLKNVSNNAVDGLGTLFGGITDLILKMVKDGKIGLEDLLGGISAVSEGLSSMIIGMYDQQIEKIEEQQEKNEEAGEEEKERIENLVNSGVISTEEGEARKRAAEKRTADKNKEFERQKAEIQQKQARWDKANSIIQATIATSLAVAKALPNFVIAAIVAAMGAAQIAMIAAQPIPKYAKGTDNHPGGLAIVGDGGKREMIVTDDGAYITPSIPTLVEMPRHAQVIPDVVDYKKMALHSDAMMLDKMRREKGDPVIVNVNNDYSRLERRFEDVYGENRKMVRYMKKMAKSAEYRYLDSRL